MAQPSVRSRPPYKGRPVKEKDDRTKFDKWLDTMIESGTTLTFKFSDDPADTGHRTHSVQPLICDRYFVYGYFPGLMGRLWFAKSAILGVSE